MAVVYDATAAPRHRQHAVGLRHNPRGTGPRRQHAQFAEVLPRGVLLGKAWNMLEYRLVISMVSKDDSHWITTGNFAKKPGKTMGIFPLNYTLW